MKNNYGKIYLGESMEIKVLDNNYKLIKNNKDAFNETEFLEKCTDYFTPYDFIVGDYAYGKLRLKGFNKKSNKNFNKYNDCTKINNYIENDCAYGCGYFILEKKTID